MLLPGQQASATVSLLLGSSSLLWKDTGKEAGLQEGLEHKYTQCAGLQQREQAFLFRSAFSCARLVDALIS